jgi:hypothetical protein
MMSLAESTESFDKFLTSSGSKVTYINCGREEDEVATPILRRKPRSTADTDVD